MSRFAATSTSDTQAPNQRRFVRIEQTSYHLLSTRPASSPHAINNPTLNPHPLLALAAQATGRSSWQTPQVLAISRWINKLIDQAFIRGDDIRMPIDPLQAGVHWQAVINHDVFIGEPRVAEMESTNSLSCKTHS